MTRPANRGSRHAYAEYARGSRGADDAAPTQRARRARLILLTVVIILGLAALAARCAQLQVLSAPLLLSLARAQHERTIILDPHRGPILDRHGRELALTLDVDSVYADPAMVKDRSAVVKGLAKILKLDRKELDKRLQADGNFVWIKRKVDPEVRKRIEDLALDGVAFVRESRRYYPKQHLAAHVVGACGVDNQGLAGLEFTYDAAIRGTPGRILFVRDGHGGHVLDLSRTEPVPGNGLILTLDSVIQHIAEREMDAAMKVSGASGAAVVVMRPQTGEILALASRPTFDPNSFPTAREEARRNNAVNSFYEPGSTFKVITVAAAIDAGAIAPGDNVWCENGSIVVGRHRFKEDSKPFGNLSLTEVLAKSSNVGAIKIALRLEQQAFLDSIREFGFGARTGLELPGESPGLVREVSSWSGLSQASMAMGQEIGVTPLQLAAAFSAIANDGVLKQPYTVHAIIGASGRPLPQRHGSAERNGGRRVISVATARALRQMLISVTSDGTGRAAAVPGYSVGGKTGTAQKIDESGRYTRGRYVAWFAGFVPADRPELVILVMLDEPQGPRFHGGDIAAPAFSRIARPVLQYLGTAPDRDGTLVFDRSARVTRAQIDAPAGAASDGGGARHAMRRRRATRGSGANRLATASLFGFSPRTTDTVTQPVSPTARPGLEPELESLMPDLTDMSMRRASEALASVGLECFTRGTGRRVTRHEPAVGTQLSRGENCTVFY